MGKNMDMLLDYHTGAAKDEILDAIHGIGGKSLLERAHETKEQLLDTFAQMRTMLMSSNLASAGHTTATRALNRFAARFSDPDTSNHTQLMREIASEATTLLSTLHAASTTQLSAGAEASRRTATALHMWNQVIRDHNQLIGVYLGVPEGPYRDTRRRRALCLSPWGQYSEAFAYHLRRRRRLP